MKITCKLFLSFLLFSSACGTEGDPGATDKRGCDDCVQASSDLDTDGPVVDESGGFALVSISHLDSIEYDELLVTVTPADGDVEDSQEFLFSRDSNEVDISIAPGRYEIVLDFFLGEEIPYSSSYCDKELRKSQTQRLQQGDNPIEINVCDFDASLASVSITPVLQ